MPTLDYGEIRVWFATDDAPAPSGSVPRGEQRIKIGLSPGDAKVRVTVRYRRRNGVWMSGAAEALPREGTEGPRYFEGSFGELAPGAVIEYTIQCHREGRPLEPAEPKTLTFEIESVATGARRKVAGADEHQVPREAMAAKAPFAAAPEGEGPPERSALATVALDVAEGDEDAADRILSALSARGVKEPRDLAAMTSGEMTSALEVAGAVSREAAASEAEKLKSAVDRTFPTDSLAPERTTIAASVPGRAQPSVAAVDPDVIDRAWKKNAGLDLLRMDLSRDSDDLKKLDLDGLLPSDKKGFLRDVRLRKSTLRAAGTASIADVLLKKGIVSPASFSPTDLAGKAGVSVARATNIHERDVQHQGRLSNGLFTLWDALRGGLQDTAVGNLRPDQVGEFFDGLDNIQELFGDMDSCDCTHCDSVIGPAAYFVDLMHFIQTHVTDERFAGNDNHRLHLRMRRPDLWGLALTCANTHTEIPQLKIVSEILENFIMTKRGLAITPGRQGIDAAVYGEVLPAGRHSVLQPLELPLREMEIYLGHFALSRSEIARRLGEAEDAQLRAVLGMSQTHANLTTIADASAVNIQNKLGLVVPPDGILPMKDLLNATGLQRDELGDLLQTRFVTGEDQPLTIVSEKRSAQSVQFDIERVHSVTLNHLDRVHRLLRLKRHLPWSPRRLDGLIASVGGALDAATLRDAGRAVSLQRRFRASVEELCALAGDLPDLVLQPSDDAGREQLTPLDVLFNVPELMRLDGAYPSPSIRYEAGATSVESKERTLRLRAGLRLDEGHLTTMVEGLAAAFEAGSDANEADVRSLLFTRQLRNVEPFPLPPGISADTRPVPIAGAGNESFPLTRLNLSLLYRHTLLARWLKLTPTDLLTLVQLTPGVGDHLANLADTVAVVDFYDWWKSTGLTLEDLTVLLAPSTAIAQYVDELWSAIRAWLVAQDDASFTDTFLTQVDGVSEEFSREFVALNVGTVFEARGDGYRIREDWRDPDSLNLDPVEGTPAADAVRELLLSQHPDERFPRALTNVLRVEVGLARAFVTAALVGSDLTPTSFLTDAAMSDDMRKALTALLRLHRVGTSLRLSSATLGFLAEHQFDLGIGSWNDPDPLVLKRLATTQALIKSHFNSDPTEALVDLERLLEDRTALPDIAASLFDIEPRLAHDLAATLRMPNDPIDALFRLEDYAEIASRLSIDATALAGIVNEEYEPASAAVAAVIAGFRAKYPDEDTWNEMVGPYQDRVLETRREGLVDFLLHGPDATFADASEMYKYFLIDSEVDGCFRTSRVVAACSSLQLYVHRIRMNLEREPEGGMSVDPSLIPEEEWSWRQHYRVWEANRKIFLWPENYLDPTIRDDKTPLFLDLEAELLQQQITDESVVDAYSNYLRSLEELANLRYAGAFHHYLEADDSGKVTDIIYLFAATGGEAPTHYWREIRNLARSQSDDLVSPAFGPWRKVETRIPTRHVSPVIYNGQLHVFWSEIRTTSQNAVEEGKSRFIGYSHRYFLKFSTLRLDGGWSTPEGVSLEGLREAFAESDNSIDDPLAEAVEKDDYKAAVFDAYVPWFGTYSGMSVKEARRKALTPRFGDEVHTKAREGYSLGGFLWERPHVSLDPSSDPALSIVCAGGLARGAVDLFDRRVLPFRDTRFQEAPLNAEGNKTYPDLLTYIYSGADTAAGGSMRTSHISVGATPERSTRDLGLPDFIVLKRKARSEQITSLEQITWLDCPFDYPFAASLALNADDLTVFQNHWGPLAWPKTTTHIADVDTAAGMWAVAGTPREVVIETEDDLLLLQPSIGSNDGYLLSRIGTTLVRDLARKLFISGIDGLLSTAFQLGLSEPPPEVSGPRTANRSGNNPIANDGAYGIYYQEIFQHIPLLIAHHLNASGRFEEARRWYHFVFDPTSPEPPTAAGTPSTDRNWKYRQFRGQEQAKLRSVLADTAAIQKYREDPFNAHAIARLRVSAYQKAVVMRYIDNLLDWADDLFTRFQMESVNEAMMHYVTAAEVLGPRPVQLGECGELSDATRTYDRLKDSISKDSDFLLEVDELIPGRTSSVPPTGVRDYLSKPPFGLKALLAFPLSKSDKPPSGANDSAPSPGNRAAGTSTGPPPTARAAIEVGLPAEATAAAAATTAVAPSTSSTPAAMIAIGGPDHTLIEGIDPAVEVEGSAPAQALRVPGGLVGSPTSPGLGGEAAGGRPPAGSGPSEGRLPYARQLPRTAALLESFALRQQFTFLGGRWKHDGGRPLTPTLGDRFARAVVRQVSAAFCIPRNETLDDYWARVEDRIQKIRTCRDITGLKRKLSLFAPEFDPMLLARAAAAGISLDDTLGAFEGTIPQHRFPYLLGKAKEFAGTVQSFGSALQSALERKDGEELVRLQATHEQQMLALTSRARQWELDTAQANLEATERRRDAVENREARYAGLLDEGLSNWEIAESIATHTAGIYLGGAAAYEFVAAVLHLIPQIGSAFAMKFGGAELGASARSLHGATRTLAQQAHTIAQSAGLEARNDRRNEEWTFQRSDAQSELDQLESQIEASRIGRDLAAHAVMLHERNQERNDELTEYHTDKFSSLGLYDWMTTQLQRTYREAFSMAYRMARYAEQAYRYEREDDSSELLSTSHWEADRAGLLAGNKLMLDLQYLDQRYIETDLVKRNLTDHVFSLRQWDPKALIALRHKGECTFTVPELFFDLTSPGDYRRRLRSVRVTIPAVAGPYTNIVATLTLDSSQIRSEPTVDLQDAPRPRTNSITTSSARNDAGAFEINFHGEDYAPFEGAGAISSWSLSLPTAVRMLDYDTISDVLLHLDYTASFDGVHRDVVQGLAAGLVSSLQDRLADGFVRAFSLNDEFPAERDRLVAGDTVELNLTGDHLPFFARSASVGEASLVFTGGDDDSPSSGNVEFDGTSLGSPGPDDQVGGSSITVPLSGAAPWKHTVRIEALSDNTLVYLVLMLRM